MPANAELIHQMIGVLAASGQLSDRQSKDVRRLNLKALDEHTMTQLLALISAQLQGKGLS